MGDANVAQVIEPNLLKEGFQFVKENVLEVTDDVCGRRTLREESANHGGELL